MSVQLRLTKEQAEALDAFKDQQETPASRSEAIRFILHDWLIGHGLLKHHEDPEGAN